MPFQINFKTGKKTSKTKKLKKPTEQQLIEKTRKKCVQKAKEITKLRDNFKCCYCGVGKPQRQVHSHHIFHEGMFKLMSADPLNLITLCATHHQGGMWMKSSTGFNFHNSPRESTEWLMEKYPERYAELKKRSLVYFKADLNYWTQLLKELSKYSNNP